MTLSKYRYLLFIPLILMGLSGAWSPATKAAPQPDPLQLALPQTALSDLQGNIQSLDQWRGKVVIVNFWATWCPPCRREIPDLIALQTLLGEKGVQFVGIAIDSAERVQRYADKQGINYPILLAEDAGNELSIQMGNRRSVLPYTAIFDRQGILSYRHAGGISRSQLTEKITPLL